MFKNYLFIALQEIQKMPMFSAVKILSLAIGLACSILVIMHVRYAYSFDKHFDNWQNIYRVVTSLTLDFRMNTVMTNDAAPRHLLLDYPQIEAMSTIRTGTSQFSRGAEQDQVSNDYLWANQDTLNVFSLDFISGDRDSALTDPYSVILNETTAAKFFPGEDPMGKSLTLEGQVDLQVTGVYRDLPINTHLEMPMFISVETARELFNEQFMNNDSWNGFGGTMTYIVLPTANEAASISADLPAFMERNLPEDQKGYAQRTDQQLYLEPLADIYLSPRQGFGQTSSTRGQIITGLSIFAALILLTSCINFANLSFSEIQKRNLEIGVRKTLGAKRGMIIWQFLVESMLLTGLALVIALPLVWFAIPVYTNLTDTGFTFRDAYSGSSVLLLVLFVLATGLISGLFPALSLARFEPASIIRGFSATSRLKRLARAGVTVVQFGFSTALIILALAVTMQIRYLNTMDLGFTKENLVLMDSDYDFRNPDVFDFDAMVNELNQHPGIVAIGKAQTFPPNTGPLNPWRLPGWAPEQSRSVRHMVVDDHYLEAMDLRLLAGRFFSPDFPADYFVFRQGPPPEAGEEQDQRPPYAVVITREAAASYGFGAPDEALDKEFTHFGDTYRVIGVVEDFKVRGGLEDPLTSTYILRGNQQGFLGNLLIRIDPNQRAGVLDYIDTVWDKHRPDLAVNRWFYEQTYNEIVDAETRGINMAGIFASIITVLISAFGLYALAFYAGQLRTKEVGVRKVLGATSKSIIGLLTWDFIKPVLVACVLAWGLGWYAIDVYFERFSAQVEISPILYIGVTLLTIVIAVVTVATQCYRSANSDPVESLRYE